MTLWEPLLAAAGLWRRALTQAWGALALYTGLYAVGLLLPLPAWALVALITAEVCVWAVASGALMRIALGDLHPEDPLFRLGPAGLQWTRIESRLLGARLLLLLLLFLILVAAVFSILLVGVVVAAVAPVKPSTVLLQNPAGIAALLVGLGFAGLTVWVATRLALSGPATADRRGIEVFSTWRLTRGGGGVGSLVLMPVLIFAAFALGFLVRALARNGGLPAGVLPEVWIAYAVLIGFVETPLALGVSAHVYRRLKA